MPHFLWEFASSEGTCLTFFALLLQGSMFNSSPSVSTFSPWFVCFSCVNLIHCVVSGCLCAVANSNWRIRLTFATASMGPVSARACAFVGMLLCSVSFEQKAANVLKFCYLKIIFHSCPFSRRYPKAASMANSFTRVMCGRNKAVMMASLGAGTLASAYLLSDGAAAAERKKLYPPRFACVCAN